MVKKLFINGYSDDRVIINGDVEKECFLPEDNIIVFEFISVSGVLKVLVAFCRRDYNPEGWAIEYEIKEGNWDWQPELKVNDNDGDETFTVVAPDDVKIV